MKIDTKIHNLGIHKINILMIVELKGYYILLTRKSK